MLCHKYTKNCYATDVRIKSCHECTNDLKCQLCTNVGVIRGKKINLNISYLALLMLSIL